MAALCFILVLYHVNPLHLAFIMGGLLLLVFILGLFAIIGTSDT